MLFTSIAEVQSHLIKIKLLKPSHLYNYGGQWLKAMHNGVIKQCLPQYLLQREVSNVSMSTISYGLDEHSCEHNKWCNNTAMPKAKPSAM